MNEEKTENIRDTAAKLNVIFSQSPTDYAYLKGWIHCLLEKENNTRKSCKPTENCSA